MTQRCQDGAANLGGKTMSPKTRREAFRGAVAHVHGIGYAILNEEPKWRDTTAMPITLMKLMQCLNLPARVE
jgi:hypothetical protein